MSDSVVLTINTFLGKKSYGQDACNTGTCKVGAVIEEIGRRLCLPVLLKGMNVTVNPYTNCGKCASCRNGRVNACEHNETLGSSA